MKTMLYVTAILLMSAAAFAADTRGIEQFNAAMIDATKKMDNAALIALWEEDGITLLPGTEPIVGRAKIGKFMDDIMASLLGAKMRSFEMRCFDIEVYGEWASEWCTEHQVVTLPNGKPPFDGMGKMLFVLHRGADGAWRLRREMWNEGVKPKPTR